MNVRTLLAVSLTLAFASATAFAQDAAPADPAAAAPAAAPAMASDAQPAVAPKHHRHHAAKHHAHGRAHVAGDPAVIDHSADHMVVTPTSTKINPPTNKSGG